MDILNSLDKICKVLGMHRGKQNLLLERRREMFSYSWILVAKGSLLLVVMGEIDFIGGAENAFFQL